MSAALFILSGCGGATAPPAAPASPAEPDVDDVEVPDTALAESIETGKDCVSAEAECEGGVCTATVQNNCEVPVTCEFNVLVMCRSETDTGEVRAKGRDTFAAGVSAELQAGGDCEGREVAGTIPDGMTCQ